MLDASRERDRRRAARLEDKVSGPVLGRLADDGRPPGQRGNVRKGDRYQSGLGEGWFEATGPNENADVDAAENLRAAARKVRFKLDEGFAESMLPVNPQHSCPEISESLLGGYKFKIGSPYTVTTGFLKWVMRWAKDIRQAPRTALSFAAYTFADFETELGGKYLDWVCAQAVGEGLSTGAWIAQVVKQYAVAYEAEDSERRALSRREAFERRRADGMARALDDGLVKERE